MDYQQPPHQSHHHAQFQQRRNPSSQSGNTLEMRREYLWRERLSRQMYRQALIARAATLEEEWDILQRRKTSMQHRKPTLAALIVLSSLVGIRFLPSERQFWYERQRLAQDEARLGQARTCCQRDLSALQAQIEVIQHELLSLADHTTPLCASEP